MTTIRAEVLDELLETEKKEAATGFLKRAVTWFAAKGVTIRRVMTDNGSCYRSKLFNKTCQTFGAKHVYTKPYTPRTNGKAERLIQTLLREWAYARPYPNSERRNADLPRWLRIYNEERAHASLGNRPPISRLKPVQ